MSSILLLLGRLRVARPLAIAFAASFVGVTGLQAQEVDPDQILGESADEAAIQRQIEDQLQRQSDLISQMLEDEIEASGPDLLAVRDGRLDSADPRVAPRAPHERQLDAAIFEEKRSVIERGTWGNREKLVLIKRVLDADSDGKPELIRYVDPESGLLIRQEQDRNYDGVIDTWSDYEWGAIVARVLDSNDDGNPDVWERYESDRVISREIDRDDDGVRDAFFRYQGDSLVDERHDATNDGKIDLIIVYESGWRVRSEEDHDRDGRMDTWTTYMVADEVELVSRIERDEQGRGYPDTFETYEPKDGKALLKQRDVDLNGDGEMDIISVYRNGKLVRREIVDPDL